MAENPRTTTARDHDDKDLIENMIPAGEAVPSTRANALGRDVASRADLQEIDDPDGTVRPTKDADISANQAYRSDRRGDDT